MSGVCPATSKVFNMASHIMAQHLYGPHRVCQLKGCSGKALSKQSYCTMCQYKVKKGTLPASAFRLGLPV